MKSKFILFLVPGVFGALTGVYGQGTLEVFNLGQTTTDTQAVSSQSWIAQEFFLQNTDHSIYALNSIELSLNPGVGTPSGFSLSIYDALTPAGYLGALTGPDPVAGGLFNYTASGVSISAGQTYYVVATAATPLSLGAYEWNAAHTFTQGDTWNIDDAYDTSPNGANWTEHIRGDVFQMAIFATQVPEPNDLVLITAGGVLFGLSRRFIWRR